MKSYYDRRAPEYDATTYELVQQDPAAARDLAELERLLAGLPPGRVLDIGCGTGWLTQFLRGSVVALDQSESMLERARKRVPDAVFVLADVPPLPFPAGSFDRALVGHVYSHIERVDDRASFVADALRVTSELIVVEQAWHQHLLREGWERRPLADGSEQRVFKRYFTADDLADELGAQVLLDTPTFVAVRRVPVGGDPWTRRRCEAGLDLPLRSAGTGRGAAWLAR
jgi:SAM-dependent methyltransferase